MTFSWISLRPPSRRPNSRQSGTSVDIDGAPMPVDIVEHARTRRLTLRILPGARALRITVPPGTPAGEIDAFLARNRAWAGARLSRLPGVKSLADGVVLPIRGVDHTIRHSGKRRGVVERLETEEDRVLLVHGDPAHLPRRVTDFLKREARGDLHAAVARHAAALGVHVNSITLRDTKSRWGSCSSNGNLSFSWRIILAPPDILDYLAAHEVAHLREMNHSGRFWSLVGEICPHTTASKTWLKANGARLHAYSA